MRIDFKGAHYPKAVIVHAVFFYVRYAVSYRDLEEILAERGVSVDHARLNLWVVKYSPLIAAKAQASRFVADVRNLHQGQRQVDVLLPRYRQVWENP